MKPKKLCLVIAAMTLPTAAWGGTAGQDRLLSSAAGMSSPGSITGFSENPAGFSGNHGFKILGEAQSDNDSFNPFGYGGGFVAGNGSVGGGLKLDGFTSSGGGNSSTSSLLDMGLAADIQALNIALGFAASYALSGGNAFGNSSFGVNAGLLYDPHGKVRVGATLFGINNSLPYVGGGISYDASSDATLTLDGNYDTNAKGISLKPALTIRLTQLEMTGGYGFALSGGGSGMISTGVCAGLGIPLGHTFALQVYFNEISRYYAGLTIAI